MNIYIDESGSINNHSESAKYFVIALVRTINKQSLQRAYKRFVSNNFKRLQKLDQSKIDPTTGKVIKTGGKMFVNGRFKELKGAQFDPEMKRSFLDFFSRNKSFEVLFIVVENSRLTDNLCDNTARAFNYLLRLALEYWIKVGKLPCEECHLQLDERNERPEAKQFLENYLNTELFVSGTVSNSFDVMYFDSSNNKLVQIADVFANIMYSNLLNGAYDEDLDKLKQMGIIKDIFYFPKKGKGYNNRTRC